MAERLLLNGEVVADTWTRVGDDDALTDADVLVSWARLQAQRDVLRSHAGRVGVVVPNTVDIRLLHHDVGWLALVVLELPVFRDGRAYSQARILRDQLGYAGEPGFEQALAIELVRRDYFLNVQHGRPSAVRLDPESLPPKTDAVRGIAWLPRLVPKALAKLRGELPPALMYCCGGDRRFFQERNLLPAEFLTFLWRHENDLGAVVDWVARRSPSSA